MFKKTMLAGAIGLVTASSAFAFDANDFFTGGSFDMELRTVVIDRDRTNNENMGNEFSAGQGVRFNYSTGQLFNVLSFDVDYYQSTKLYGKTGKGNSTDILELGPDGRQNSYQKLAATAKLDFSEGNLIHAGRRFMNYPLLSDSDIRVTPSLTEAINGEFTFGNGRAYGAYATGGNARTGNDFNDYEVDGKKRAVSVIGADYDFGIEGSRLEASFGTQDDFADHYWLRGVFANTFNDLKLTLDTQFFGKQLQGATKNKLASNADDSTWQSSARLRGDYNNFSLSVGYQKVAETEGLHEVLSGPIQRWSGGSDFTRWHGLNAGFWLDFDKNGSESYSVRFDHRLDQVVPGLSYFLRYTTGSWVDNGNNGKKLNDSEFDAVLAYTAQNAALKGFSMELVSINTREERVDAKDQKMHDMRLFVHYRKSFF